MKIASTPSTIATFLTFCTVLASCGEVTSPITDYPTTLVPDSFEERTAILGVAPEGSGGWVTVSPEEMFFVCLTVQYLEGLVGPGNKNSSHVSEPAFRFTSDSTCDFITWHNSSRWEIVESYSYTRNGNDYTLANDSDTIFGRAEGDSFSIVWMGVCATYGDSTERYGASRLISLRSTEVDPNVFGIFHDSTKKPLMQVAYQIGEVRYVKK